MKIKLLAIATLLLFGSFKQADITWTAIGDSITYLNDHQNETGNRITKGYMTMVTEKLSNIHYTNQGHNGWTTVGIAKSIETLGLQKSDIYSVFLGTLDDYKNNTGVNTTFGAYRIIINKIKSLNANAKIVLITPLQRTDFVYINNGHNNAYGSYKEKNGQRLSQFAAAVKQIGEYEHLPVADLYNKKSLRLEKQVNFKRLKDPQTGTYKNYQYPDFIGIPYNPDTDEYPYPVEAVNTTYDGLHPSDKGYEIIAGILVKILKKY